MTRNRNKSRHVLWLLAALVAFAPAAWAQEPPKPPEPEKKPPTVFAGVFTPLVKTTPDGRTITRSASEVLARLFHKDDEKLVDLSADVFRGKLDLGDAKVLIIDASALAKDEGRLAKILTDGKTLVSDFVTAGGVLVVFTRTGKGVRLGFLPGKMEAYPTNTDHARRVAVDPAHPLLSAEQKLTAADLGSTKGLLYPGGCYAYYSGLVPVVAYDRRGRYPIVLEGSVGKGRVILVHLSAVHAFAFGAAAEKQGAERLLENLLAYVRRVLKGEIAEAKPVKRTLRVTVFEDTNANGRRDAGEKPIVKMPLVGTFSETDATGRVDMELDAYTRFVQVDADLAKYHLPFWKRVPEDAERLDFGLVPREKPFGDLTRVAYLVDTGPLPAGEDEQLRFMLAEIARVAPKVNLLVVVTDSAEDVRPRYAAIGRLDPSFEVVHQPIQHLLRVPIAESDRWQEVCGPDPYLYGGCRLHGEEVKLDWRSRFSSDRLHALRFRHAGLGGPPTFALVDFPRTPDEFEERELMPLAGGTYATLHIAGVNGLLAPIHPALEATVRPGELDLSVAVGDTAFDAHVPLKIELAHIKRKGELLELVELKPETPLVAYATFTREIALDLGEELSAGFYALKLTAGAPGGRTWGKTVSFVVPEKAPPESTIGRPWLTTGGNAFHSGDAMETVVPPFYLASVTNVGGRVLRGSPVVTSDGVLVRHTGDGRTDAPGVRGIKRPFCVHEAGRFRLVLPPLLSGKPWGRMCVLLETPGGPPGKFRFDFGEALPQPDATHLVVGGDFLCVVDATGRAWGFKRTAGAPLNAKATAAALRWSVPIAPGCRQAVATDGFLFTGNACREIANGMLQWKLDGRTLRDASVALHKKHAVITGVTTEPKARQVVLVVKSDSGKRVWEKELARVRALDDVMTPPPAIARGMVFVGSADGVMRAFRLDDGALLWEFKTGPSVIPHSAGPDRFGPRISSQAVVSGRNVFFGSADGVLYALDRTEGKPRWRRKLGLPITASPAISGNSLFIADWDGNLHTFVSLSRRKR